MKNAPRRKAWDSAWSSCEPAKRMLYPEGREPSKPASKASASTFTALALYPARTSEDTVTTRSRSFRLMPEKPVPMCQLAIDESGTWRPSSTTFRSASALMCRYASASRTVMSYSSFPSRYFEASAPLMAFLTVKPMSRVEAVQRRLLAVHVDDELGAALPHVTLQPIELCKDGRVLEDGHDLVAELLE